MGCVGGEYGAHSSQVSIVSIRVVIASEHVLLQRRTRNRREEFRTRDIGMELRAHRPTYAVTKRNGLGHRAAVNHQTRLIERAHGTWAHAAVMEVAVNIVLDNRHFVMREYA